MNNNAPGSFNQPPIDTPALPSTRNSDSDARPQDIKALNRAIERIRKANLPPAPYIVSVDGAFYKDRSPGFQWTLNSPFSPQEGHLQYQTLLYRDTSTSLLRLRAAHEDEESRGNQGMNTNGTNAKTDASTPLNASSAAKKKISLGDYKSRKEAGSKATTPTAQQSQSADLRKETLKRELEASTDPAPIPSKVEADMESKPTTHGSTNKRPASELEDQDGGWNANPEAYRPTKKALGASVGDKMFATTHAADEPKISASDKPKTPVITVSTVSSASPSSQPSGMQTTNAEQSGNAVRAGNDLKVERVSSKEKGLCSWLPKMMSEALRGQKSWVPTKFNRSVAQGRAPPRLSVTKPTTPKVVKAKGASSTFFKSFEVGKKAPASRSEAEKKPQGSQPPPTGVVAAEETCLVKLKYGKDRAGDVERILQKPAPQKEAAPQSTGDQPQAPVNAAAHARHRSVEQQKPMGRAGEPGHDATSRKRPAAEVGTSNEPPEKKQKANAGTSPQTPPKARLLSPAPVTPKNVKRQVSPSSVKDAKSAAQQTVTPEGVSLSPNLPSSINLARSTAEEGLPREAWKAEYEKNMELAKKLRVNMLNAFKAMSPGDTKEDSSIKIAAVQGLESVLCFMKAFAAQARFVHENKTMINTWQSVMPWTSEVARGCERFPHLHGFALLLRSVCCAELGNAFTRVNLNELGGSSPSGRPSSLKLVLDNFSNMRRYASGSEHFLPRATMAATYPSTYEACSLMPMGMVIDAGVAIKAGCRFLTEWTSLAKAQWSLQLEASSLA